MTTMSSHKDEQLAEIYYKNKIEEEEFERFKKKLYIGLSILVVVVCLTAAVLYMYCISRTMRGYFEKHPNTEWESIDPYMHISVDEKGKATSYMELEGELILIGFGSIGRTNTTVIYNYNNAQKCRADVKDVDYLKGEVRFRHDRIIFKITNDYTFDGKYSEIVLYQVE